MIDVVSQVGMCVVGTPVTREVQWGLWVKHEEACCPGGPNFSKCRGVYTHVSSRPEAVMGVLDTSHSQGGWAVARACSLLGRRCRLYYPRFKRERPLPPQQQEAARLGADLVPLQAGRSAVLYHRARRHLLSAGSTPGGAYMMPNALKLPETVSETAAEVGRTLLLTGSGVVDTVLVSASSGTIAAGVVLGLQRLGWRGCVVVHMGYSRPQQAVAAYMERVAGVFSGGAPCDVTFVDEGYDYADEARSGPTPPWPCNAYYDLKAFRWWVAEGRARYGEALLWNIG